MLHAADFVAFCSQHAVHVFNMLHLGTWDGVIAPAAAQGSLATELIGRDAFPASSTCLRSLPCPLQIVAMIPPTPSNLSCYAAWLPKSKSEMAFLAANCKGASAQQVIMRPGETLLIPG